MTMVEPTPPPDPLAGHPQFTKIKDLGIGSFGSVALYQRQEERGEPSLCAVKFMPRSGPGVDVNLIQREIQSHRVLRHPHVIRFKQLGLTQSHMYMCMEYADQGDLLGFLCRKGPLPEADARWLFQQIIFGLDYCHLKGVVNRDLKPENLLLKLTPEASKRHRRQQLQEREAQEKQLESQLAALRLQQQQQQQGGSPPPPALPALPPPPVPGLVEHRTSNTFSLHIKIADFGLSKRAAHSLPKTRVGTINYMAPEVLLAGPTQRYDGAKADIWSAGVVLYAMLFSRVPFEVTNDGATDGKKAGGGGGPRDRAATIQRILNGDWAVPPGMGISPCALHLLSQMLSPDPQRRIAMAAIMEHSWFRAGLPPAALTMNTALVRQQAAQAAAGGSAGEQTEADIDELLEELRKQAEREAAAAAVPGATASVCSHDSAAAGGGAGDDDGAEERRLYDVRGFPEAGSPPVARPYAGKSGESPTGAGRVLSPGEGGVAPPAAPLSAEDGGGGGGGGQRREGGIAADKAARGGNGGAPALPQGLPAELRGSPGRGAVTAAGAPTQAVPTGGRAAKPAQAVPAPNAFLARLACFNPEDLGPSSSSSGGGGCGPAAMAAAAAAGGGGALAPGSSASRRAEALEAIDCVRLGPGRIA